MRLQHKRPGKRIGVTLAALTITTGLGFTVPVEAQSGSEERNVTRLQQIEDVGGPQRIDNSGKLRMLSQRIPAAACVLSTSPDSKFVRESLVKARDKFDGVLAALRDGNDEYGIIGVESDRRVLRELDAAEKLWLPFKAAIDGILAGKDVDKNMEFLAANNITLLDETVLLVSEISREYSHPAEMSAAGAILVNISGRQRMLLQKIAKEYCGVVHGIDALGTQADLDATLSLFDAVLLALINGQLDAGVQPPPTDDIRQKLQTLDDEWHKYEAILDKDAHSSEAHYEIQIELFKALSREVNELSVIVALYAAAARIGG